MRSYEERAMDFVKELYPYLVDCGAFDRHILSRYATAVSAFNDDKHRKVHFAHGIARVAFITSDYVIKYEYNPNNVDFYGGCENEVIRYARAEEEGFAYLFAKISRYIYEGHVFYIMPKVYGIGREQYEDKYADEFMTEEESDFVYGLGISDMHYQNYGFRKGHVCLVDYAGGEAEGEE